MLLNQFKPSSKIFYWPFQGGTSFVVLLCFFCLVFAMPLWASVYMSLVVTCWERADLLAFVRLWCPTVSLSLSHWYPGSGVVLDCINSWSLHPYLLCNALAGALSSFAIISLRKRELVALLLLCSCSHVAVSVLCLFFVVPWVGLWLWHFLVILSNFSIGVLSWI